MLQYNYSLLVSVEAVFYGNFNWEHDDEAQYL